MDWILPSDVTVTSELAEAVGGPPLVAEILARRGVTDPAQARAFLDPSQYTPAPPEELPDVEKTAGRLLEAIQKGERVLVWGDFDVDGQTSTSLLVDALGTLGAEVSYHIPQRMGDGHGVQPERLKPLLEDGIDVVLTCDTGVAAHGAAEMVRAARKTLLITDHHALPEHLPDAEAVVNPQRLPPGHALRDLPGVGVTYKLVQYLFRQAGRAGEEKALLDLVALGIVADVAAQRRDTRYLLQLGLDALRYPKRTGLQALMRAAQVDPANLSADTIGFQVGPRLNALGRLGDANRAVTLLTTDDELLAQQIAAQLEVLNNQRKQIENDIYAAAQDQIVKDSSLLQFEALVLAGEHWHPGVIGIVASRLVEQYGKPTVLFAAPPGEIAHGSARSVPGVNIGAAIAANGDMLIGHGGHPGAAGCSLDGDLIPQFRRRLSNTVRETWDHSVQTGLRIDAEISLPTLTMDLAEDLNRLAPFGEGNPPLHLMAPAVWVAGHRPFGMKNQHLRLTVEDDEGTAYELIWWRGAGETLPKGTIDLVLIPRINDYKGRRSLQMEWVASRPTPGAVVEVVPRLEVIDLRKEAHPREALEGITVKIWAEGLAQDEMPLDPGNLITRYTVGRAPALVIWTAPPGPQALAQMIDLTGAETVYVVARHSPKDEPEVLLRRLAGLVKYALKEYGGELSVLRLAAATSQREATIRAGLDWLAAKGQITLEWIDADRAQIVPEGTPDPDSLAMIQGTLNALLREAAAYRAYFRQADLKMFFHQFTA